MRNYGAITIGPIIETISSVSTPGALWCASGIFSDLMKNICEKIFEKIPDAKIISPAYEKGVVYTDGIGRWHDRAFFYCSLELDEIYSQLEIISKEVKGHLAKNVAKAAECKDIEAVNKYVDNYIQINWVVAPEEIAEAEGKNCILNLSQYLDSEELSGNFSHNETHSPFTKLFNGRPEAKNIFIKNCWLIPEGNKKIQIFDKEGNIRDIESIANPEKKNDDKKFRSYFAVVQSDGDEMGNCIKSCSGAADVEAFSDVCIKYTEAAAKLIESYGGLTVYAGGDDLLFLAPLTGVNGENILTLCKKITEKFDTAFEEFCKEKNCFAPTLSFGVSVNYVSSPLYEAVEEVVPLLMYVAKNESKKNNIAISLHKHSGQSAKFVVSNRWEEGTPLNELEKLINKGLTAGDDTDETLKSVLYALDTFGCSYELCRSKGIDTQNFFDNTFDNAGQESRREYINSVKRFGDTVAADGNCLASDTNPDAKGKLTDKEIPILNAMLRFVKLYSERGVG